MRYPITKRVETMIRELHAQVACIDTLLDVASSEARDEWKKLLQRLPAIAELKSGVMTLSEAELEEMTSKVSRFAAILRADSARAGRPPRDPANSARRPS